MFQKINSFFTSKKNSNLINEISNKYLKKINQLESQILKLTREEMISQIEGMKQKKSMIIFLNYLRKILVIFVRLLERRLIERLV